MAYTWNFGQRDFKHTPPSGYKALNTYNLPDPTIEDPSKHFNTVIYEGDPGQTNEVTGVGFEPDLVWIKNLDNANSHGMFDQVRGDTKLIYANLTAAEDTISDFSFTSDGFTTDSTDNTYNNSFTYVSWNWEAGTTNVTKEVGALSDDLYDQSDDWSGNGTSDGNTTSGQGWDKAFDNERGSYYKGAYTLGSSSSTFTFDTSNKPTWSNKIEVYFRKYDGTANVNGGSDFTTVSEWTTAGVYVEGWYDISSIAGTSGTLSTITTTDVANNYVSIQSIRLDGKILVDSTVSVADIPSIESTYRANPEAGFSIINYTGTLTAGTVAHGLNATPNFVLAKNREAANDWVVYHSDLSAAHTLYLNGNGVQGSAPTIWPGAHDSDTVNIGDAAVHNATGQEQLMYAWSEVAGYSKFGKYDGTAVANPGPAYVYCGFRPAWVMVKNRDAAEDWFIWDSERDGYNPIYQHLEIYSADVQNATTNDGVIDILSNGFKIRSQYSPNNANTYVFAAFAESPFKYANAR